MTGTLLDISGRIDPHIADALALVWASTAALATPFFIIGAMARNILFKSCFGLEPRRATLDIDLGVSVAAWDDYKQLRQVLIEACGFEETHRIHRLRHHDCQIDIIPFGLIAGPKHIIAWPPDGSVQMSTAGFEEAFRASQSVRMAISPDLIVNVCSLPGLVIMKLISWNERYPERRRDAEDIREIMENYGSAEPIDRLYEKEEALLIEEGFDRQKSGIRLLGRSMAKIAGPETAQLILKILDAGTREDSDYRLPVAMLRGMPPSEADLEGLIFSLAKLKHGFVEYRNPISGANPLS